MTANAEAQSLLDQLMGADRNALLPTGAALPRKSKRPLAGDRSGGMILPGTKRSKSCYDRDVDPLFCAWGVDVFELFVNTKSDIGPNPFLVDEAARKEYISLSRDEKERLGFEYRLFSKMQELVQHCDRTVSRNNEKLKRELQRQSAKRGGNDYVVDVSEEKVEEVVRAEIKFEKMKDDLKMALIDLMEIQTKEETVLELQRQEQKEQLEKKMKDQVNDETKLADQNNDEEVDSEDKTRTMKVEDEETGTDFENKAKTEDVKISLDCDGVDQLKKETDLSNDDNDSSIVKGSSSSGTALEELGRLTLKKQKLLCQVANIVSQLGPLEESIEVQHLKLNFVRSDTTTDKTVCEVSGNFMSARDADERIAAHYAGKQYVGWKLVRDKFQEMIKKYGRYGPPRPSPPNGGRGVGSGAGAPLMSYQQMQQRGGGSRRRDDGGSNYRNGRRTDDRRGSSRGDDRWERGGGGGYDRGGYDGRGRRGSDYRDNRGRDYRDGRDGRRN